MVVALTPRHMRDLVRLTGQDAVVTALEQSLGADFSTDADRYRHRNILNAVFGSWFAERTGAEVIAALENSSVLFERYRTFGEVVRSGELEANPLFTPLEQPGIGAYLAAGLPAAFDANHLSAGAAPQLADGSNIVRQLLRCSTREAKEMIEGGYLGMADDG